MPIRAVPGNCPHLLDNPRQARGGLCARRCSSNCCLLTKHLLSSSSLAAIVAQVIPTAHWLAHLVGKQARLQEAVCEVLMAWRSVATSFPNCLFRRPKKKLQRLLAQLWQSHSVSGTIWYLVRCTSCPCASALIQYGRERRKERIASAGINPASPMAPLSFSKALMWGSGV